MIRSYQELGSIFQEVVPRIYLGSQSSTNESDMKLHAITHILSIGCIPLSAPTHKLFIDVQDDEDENIAIHFDTFYSKRSIIGSQ